MAITLNKDFKKGEELFMVSSLSVDKVTVRHEPTGSTVPVVAENGFLFNVERRDLFRTALEAEEYVSRKESVL